MYKVFPDPEVLLPQLITDIPTLQVVKSQRIEINVDTAGETMAQPLPRTFGFVNCKLEPVVICLRRV